MPALADVSSTFDWTLRNDPAALGSWTIQNTRRTFRVTQVLVTGTAGLTVTVRKNTGAGVGEDRSEILGSVMFMGQVDVR